MERKEYKARYYQEHKDECRAHSAKHYLDNKEDYAARSKLWQANHKEYKACYNQEHKEENKAYRKRWYSNNKEKYKEQQARYNQTLDPEERRMSKRGAHLKNRYGITLEEYDEMNEAQGGVCAACGGSNGSRVLCVDHDHRTEEVRGLLCDSCNFVLGHVDDNIDTLMALVRYLEKYQ
jgi:hypothetical protein